MIDENTSYLKISLLISCQLSYEINENKYFMDVLYVDTYAKFSIIYLRKINTAQ